MQFEHEFIFSFKERTKLKLLMSNREPKERETLERVCGLSE